MLRKTTALIALTALAMASQLALAQTGEPSTPAEGAPAEALERVTVTGSRIKSLSLAATSPVAQVGAGQIGPCGGPARWKISPRSCPNWPAT